MTARINLQNSPLPAGVLAEPFSFERDGLTLVGTLYRPADAARPVPGVLVTGAWTTVKEQMAGTYARELAARGFAALAFDFTGWGASGGTPRHVEDPAAKTADILAAADALAAHPAVDADRLSGLGVCASSGYMAAAVADHPKLQRLALVAAWLHDPAMAEGIYGGADAVAGLVSQTEGEIDATGPAGAAALMPGVPYYSEADRGLVEAYDNRFALASWKPWLTYDAQVIADRLAAPTLLVCSEAAALPAGAHAFVARTTAPVRELWLDGVSQFDFYDRADVVAQVSDAVAAHLSGPLSPGARQAAEDAVAGFLRAVDDQDWAGMEARMTDRFLLDYESFGAGPAAWVAPGDVTAGWKALLPGFDATHHQLGQVSWGATAGGARLRAAVTGEHVLEGRVWRVMGAYDITLVGDARGMRLERLVFAYRTQVGDLDLPEAARMRLLR